VGEKSTAFWCVRIKSRKARIGFATSLRP